MCNLFALTVFLHCTGSYQAQPCTVDAAPKNSDHGKWTATPIVKIQKILLTANKECGCIIRMWMQLIEVFQDVESTTHGMFPHKQNALGRVAVPRVSDHGK